MLECRSALLRRAARSGRRGWPRGPVQRAPLVRLVTHNLYGRSAALLKRSVEQRCSTPSGLRLSARAMCNGECCTPQCAPAADLAGILNSNRREGCKRAPVPALQGLRRLSHGLHAGEPSGKRIGTQQTPAAPGTGRRRCRRSRPRSTLVPSLSLPSCRQWAEAQVRRDPRFFTSLVATQMPQWLWWVLLAGRCRGRRRGRRRGRPAGETQRLPPPATCPVVAGWLRSMSSEAEAVAAQTPAPTPSPWVHAIFAGLAAPTLACLPMSFWAWGQARCSCRRVAALRGRRRRGRATQREAAPSLRRWAGVLLSAAWPCPCLPALNPEALPLPVNPRLSPLPYCPSCSAQRGQPCHP